MSMAPTRTSFNAPASWSELFDTAFAEDIREIAMDEAAALTKLDEKLVAHHMRGQWKSEAFLSAALGGARPAGVPALWKWSQVMELLDDARQAMPESLQARRSLIFQNPGLPRGTSHTINMGVQMIVPGEVAWAHRHSIAALRFIIDGDPDLTTI